MLKENDEDVSEEFKVMNIIVNQPHIIHFFRSVQLRDLPAMLVCLTPLIALRFLCIRGLHTPFYIV